MEIETELICPLGCKCEEIKNGKINRCVWYIKLVGQNPQTGENIDDQGCAMSWMPILLIENSKATRGTNSAIESFRNDITVGQNMFNNMIINARRNTELIN